MSSGASTPEELESLLEDGFVTSDRGALTALFDANAVLCAGPQAAEARGSEQILHASGALCARGYSYLAEPRRVLQAGDVALMVGEQAINVIRRGADRRWRYAISLLDVHHTNERSSR